MMKTLAMNNDISDSSNFGVYRGILKTSAVSWMYMPDDLILEIFEFLNCQDLGNAAQVCRRWKIFANKEYLWRRLLQKDFNVNSKIPLHPGARSWKQEYERLSDRVPCVELDKIEEHTDEVLHVAFSNNGMMFCTCSKDSCVKVYNADWPFNTVFSCYLGELTTLFRWKYTQLSQFSPCDTQLLVSGRCSGSEHGGEIVIFNIFAGNFTVQSRVRICPYDVMGTWLNETHILSARAHCITHAFQCLCEVMLNKSSQEIENPHESTVTRMFLFRCNNFATVNYLRVIDLAKPLRLAIKNNTSDDFKDLLHDLHYQYLRKNVDPSAQLINNIEEDHFDQLCVNCKETPSEKTIKKMKMSLSSKTPSCFSFCSKKNLCDQDQINIQSENDPNMLLKSCGINASDTNSTLDFNTFQSEDRTLSKSSLSNTSFGSSKHVICASCGKPIGQYNEKVDDAAPPSEADSSCATSADEEANRVTLPKHYKLLLAFTGSLVGIPHQIGIKIIEQEECSKVVDRDISQMLHSIDHNHSRSEIDTWDHVLELRGQGVGMTTSSCNRFLYVNVRRWLKGVDPDQLFDAVPPISGDIELLVYDLVTMKQVSTLTGHSAISSVFFLHLTSNDLYVASGSEDDRGYIWDRHYETSVATLQHENVVNCVAVNPRDPSMAVSVSDDKSIKIWRSKAFSRLLKGARAKARIKFRSHPLHSCRS